MSRYLELSVDGTLEEVGERALRAFRRIGKVAHYDLASPQISGTIKIDGEIAEVRVSWKPGRTDRVRVEIAATSDDTLSRAADGALYAYARTYKAVGWPDPERDRKERREKTLRMGAASLAVLLLGTLIYLLIRTSNYNISR